MTIGTEKKDEPHKLLMEHNIFIKWKPEYNLDIPILDEHHRGIVTIINSLHFGIQNNYASEILTPIVEMMNDYTRIHFQTEEKFQHMINFPHAKAHHELHLELSGKLKQMGRDTLLHRDSYQFMDFLKKWWINHICHEDLAFRNHILKK